jgi:hypothetical protein
MTYCDDCGCKMYNGHCTNCHEEVFIVQQYQELGMELPSEETEFMQKFRKIEREDNQ